MNFILSDQSSNNSESDYSSDELPDLEDSDRDSEYSDVDSEDSEYSDEDSEDSEDSDEEELGPDFINFINTIFGKLKFIGCLIGFFTECLISSCFFLCVIYMKRPKLLLF